MRSGCVTRAKGTSWVPRAMCSPNSGSAPRVLRSRRVSSWLLLSGAWQRRGCSVSQPGQVLVNGSSVTLQRHTMSAAPSYVHGSIFFQGQGHSWSCAEPDGCLCWAHDSTGSGLTRITAHRQCGLSNAACPLQRPRTAPVTALPWTAWGAAPAARCRPQLQRQPRPSSSLGRRPCPAPAACPLRAA